MPPRGKSSLGFLFAFLANKFYVQYKLIDCIIGVEIEFPTNLTIMDEYLNVL